MPFHLESRRAAATTRICDAAPAPSVDGQRPPRAPATPVQPASESGGDSATTIPAPIGRAGWRQRVRVVGQVRSMRIQPLAGVATLECVLFDDTGGLSIVFLGRRQIAGIGIGTHMLVEGVVGDFHGRLAILNPSYQLLDP